MTRKASTARKSPTTTETAPASAIVLRMPQSATPAPAEAAPMDEGAAMLAFISRAASDPTVNVDIMERLLAMHQGMQARKSEQAFAEAMSKAQEAMRPIAADCANKSTSSRYASFAALDRATRPIYTANGFALSYDTVDCPLEQHIRVVCYVTQKAGHRHRYQVDIPCDGKGAKGGDVMSKTHAAGSAFSYGQRYLLKLIFNIAVGDDDDGNAAGSAAASGPVNNGAPGCISPDQAQTINDLIKRNGANIDKFCARFSIEAVPDLPTKQYRLAVEMLNAFGINNATKKKETV